MKIHRSLGWVLHGILFLFFFQLLTDFIEAVYAFGLLGTSIPVEIVSVLFLFSPFCLLFLKDKPSTWGRRALFLTAGFMIAARLLESLLDTRSRMVVSGFGVSCFLLLFPMWLHNSQAGSPMHTRDEGAQIGAGLTLAVTLSILLRAFNSGSDLSSSGAYQFIAWVLALAALILLYRRPDARSPSISPVSPDKPAPQGKVAALILGVIAVLALLYLSFTSPNVIARWTGANYLVVLSVTVLALVIFAWLWARQDQNRAIKGVISVSPQFWVWNAVFVLALLFTILPYQIVFPSDPGAYPLADPSAPPWSPIPLLALLVLYPVLFLDFTLLTQELLSLRLTWRSLGFGFGLAALYLLLLVFAHVFTTVYDYIPVVGPFFRDQFWLVYLVAAAVPVASLLQVRRKRIEPPDLQASTAQPVIVTILGAAALIGALLTQSRPGATPTEVNNLRMITYNIQQGYNQAGQKNYEGQVDLIRSADPDLVGLQETDTNRIAGGNADLVRFFADRLGMQSYYGPRSVAGTFGIALLSKYPILKPRTFYMFSQGEQTAAIHAQIQVDGIIFNIFVTHLGNAGPIIQLKNLLAETAGLDHVILMGDFNFSPDTAQYALVSQQLDDAWLLGGSSGMKEGGWNPSERIDHIFLSPGIQVTQAVYLDRPESDHPPELVEIEW